VTAIEERVDGKSNGTVSTAIDVVNREREREREREKGGGRELLAVFVYEDTSTRKRIYKIESIFQPLPSFLLLIKRYRYNRF